MRLWAAFLISAPVDGLRCTRAFTARGEKVPNPVIAMRPFLAGFTNPSSITLRANARQSSLFMPNCATASAMNWVKLPVIFGILPTVLFLPPFAETFEADILPAFAGTVDFFVEAFPAGFAGAAAIFEGVAVLELVGDLATFITLVQPKPAWLNSDIRHSIQCLFI